MIMTFRGEVHEHRNGIDFKTPSKPFDLEFQGLVVLSFDFHWIALIEFAVRCHLSR